MNKEKSHYVLEMKNITKLFPGVLALDKVNLKVRHDTVHVLIGENGAGKSTLMKVLSGEHQIDEGEIYFKGVKLDTQNTKAALNMGIAMIHQELSPILDMTIAENIFLDREPTYGPMQMFVDFKKLYKQTQELLDKLGLEYDPHMRMRELSVAGMQLIEITKAISRGASLIIMDEPTSAITDTEVTMLFDQIRDLKANGVAIIYITHKMDEIFQIADDITIIRDGQYVDSNQASYYNENKLISLMVGRTISNIFPKETAEIGELALEVRNITRKGVFKDISFKVRKGEIVGLAGLVGAGRTEVARAIFGLDPLDSGEILLEGKPLKIRQPLDTIQKGIAMCSEDRKIDGCVLCRSVLENISMTNLKKFAPGLFIDLNKEAAAAKNMIEMLRIKVPTMYANVNTLSGGNQQKVILAKWLMGDLKVLILDEPTRGIDVGSKSEIHKLMSKFVKEGLAIIMISSELPEILGMSDRVIVMKEGKITGEIMREEASQENIMTLATGGKL
jgi:inositol transport system ATP-binding protein